jgi:hypothetical protein
MRRGDNEERREWRNDEKRGKGNNPNRSRKKLFITKLTFYLLGKNFIRRNLSDCKVFSDSNFIPFKRGTHM